MSTKRRKGVRFVPLSEKTLTRLMEKGGKDAEELTRAIRAQFELSAADAELRLR